MRAILVLLCLLVSVRSWAAPTPDAAQSARTINATTLDWNITVGGGCTNRLMTVKVWVKDGTISTVNSVTVGGNAATFVNSSTATGTKTVEIWRYIAPATGTVAIHVGVNVQADFINGLAESWCGVDQTTPLGTSVPAAGTTSPATVNISSAAGELVTDAAVSEIGSGLTVGAGQTQTYNQADSSSASYNAAASYENGAGTVTMSWTQSPDDYWAIVGVPIKPATTTTRHNPAVVVFQ